MVSRTTHPVLKWLLLITNLPGRNQTLRMRVWRALKGAGAGSLRDGVYVLPHSAGARRIFLEQASEIQSGAGSAHVLALQADSAEQQSALIALFDRSGDYRKAMAHLRALQQGLPKLEEVEARRRLAALRRDVAGLAAVDFFGGEARTQMEAALADGDAALNARFAPDEPHSTRRRIVRLDPGNYRGRIWATRQHLWIDRVCSAWLIRRFIDPRARFRWLRDVSRCPKSAIGFDFDGAQFTHLDAKVTFEVLAASFGLDKDPGLARLGALVHYLDVGGIPVVEAAGFEAIVSGARALQPNDDALLRAVSSMLDSLYASYGDSTGEHGQASYTR
jgi:hypothetical protein